MGYGGVTGEEGTCVNGAGSPGYSWEPAKGRTKLYKASLVIYMGNKKAGVPLKGYMGTRQ